LRLDKLDLLPPALEALIDTDVWGVGPPGAPSPTKLQPTPAAAAGAAAGGQEGAAAAAAGVAAAAADSSNGSSVVPGQQGQQPAAGATAAAGSPVVSRPLQSARQRRAAAGATGNRGRGIGGGVGVGGAFLRSVTQLIALQEPEYAAKYATQVCTGGERGPEGHTQHARYRKGC